MQKQASDFAYSIGCLANSLREELLIDRIDAMKLAPPLETCRNKPVFIAYMIELSTRDVDRLHGTELPSSSSTLTYSSLTFSH